MKRTDLVRKLMQDGCVLTRHGGNTIGIATQRQACLSRCPGIGISVSFLAKHILKKLAS